MMQTVLEWANVRFLFIYIVMAIHYRPMRRPVTTLSRLARGANGGHWGQGFWCLV